MISPNFAAGEAFIEAQMRDECEVIRERSGAEGRVLDEQTGALLARPGSIVTVYSGKCDVKQLSAAEVAATVAGHDQYNKRYKILVPVSAADIRQGDILKVTVAVRDPMLSGHEFKIHDVTKSTNRVYRSLDVTDMSYQVRVPD